MYDPSKIPDLSHLEQNLKKRYLLRVFIPSRRDGTELTVERTFVRLVDKALRNYTEARRTIIDQQVALEQQQERGGLSLPSLQFPDYFEDCIITTNRLFDLLKLIDNGALTVSPHMQASIRDNPPDKTCREKVNTIRNAVEHIGQRLDVISKSYVVLWVSPSGDSAEIGPWRIGFAQIAAAIECFHKIAEVAVSHGFD